MIYDQVFNLYLMCSTCGCGIDLGNIETVFAKDYRCIDCGQVFKGYGWKPECQRCKSKNTKAVK